MGSVAVLADELPHADAESLENTWAHYERRRRDQGDRGHDKSRWLGRFAVVDNPLLARLWG